MKVNLRPIITETTMSLAKKNWYTFAVPKEFGKDQLKKIIQDIFKVEVLAVKTLRVKGKSKRLLKTRKIKKFPDWKKAMFKLKEGQKIDLYE